MDYTAALKIFRMVATEFAAIPDEDATADDGTVTYGVTSYMDIFKDQISKKRFGAAYDKALAYLTAHKLKMMGYGDNSGVGGVTIADSLRANSVSEGETSVSFSASSAIGSGSADAEYQLTVYGLEFLTIRKNAIIPIVSAGEAPLP